ncbi:hypothetical protein Taro_049124 [Colocasia esculenta]|uniref:Uncharacterized protein n=1 Tax=Colocasia esculenta TaxID=4460 RepID=A0A843XA46_COLES|nr:hypothetical protein [Colocasia esculenta]
MFLSCRPVRSRVLAVQGQHLQQCSVASCLLLQVVPRGEGEQEASHPSSSSEPHCSGAGYAPYVVVDNTMMVEYFIIGLQAELQDGVIPLMCRTVEEVAQRAVILERTVRARQR